MRLGDDPDDQERPEPEWQNADNVKAYQHVLAQIEQHILLGRLTVGDHLPTERQLGSAIGVSRTSVREALRTLEAMDVVQVSRGRGAASGARIARPTDAFARMLKLHIALGTYSMREIIQIRCALESWAAAMCAAAPDRAVLEPVRATLTRMGQQNLASSAFWELDTEFHFGLGEASGNQLLIHLMAAIRDSATGFMRESVRPLDDWSEIRRLTIVEHCQILTAIEAQQADAASRLSREHVMRRFDVLIREQMAHGTFAGCELRGRRMTPAQSSGDRT